MTHLRLKQYSGTTFGMEAQSTPAFRKMKRMIYNGEVIPHGRRIPIKCRCISAEYVAPVMGQAAWLITNRHAETIWWDGSYGEIYIIYKDSEEQQKYTLER